MEYIVAGLLLLTLFRLERKLMATQEELTAQVNEVTAQIGKIGGETTTLLTKISELTAIIESQGQVTPELEAAVMALKAQAAIVDELVPDAG